MHAPRRKPCSDALGSARISLSRLVSRSPQMWKTLWASIRDSGSVLGTTGQETRRPMGVRFDRSRRMTASVLSRASIVFAMRSQFRAVRNAAVGVILPRVGVPVKGPAPPFDPRNQRTPGATTCRRSDSSPARRSETQSSRLLTTKATLGVPDDFRNRAVDARPCSNAWTLGCDAFPEPAVGKPRRDGQGVRV